MERDNRGLSPHNELTIETRVNKSGYERPHGELVRGFKGFIGYMQQVHQEHMVGDRNPSEVIRHELDWRARTASGSEEGEFFSTLRYAWDILAYEHYPPGSGAENLAGSTIQMYYQHYLAAGEPRESIILTDPVQIRMIDALTEAAGIPHKRGRTEIAIPEHLKNYSTWTLAKARRGQESEIQSNIPRRLTRRQK